MNEKWNENVMNERKGKKMSEKMNVCKVK